MKVENQEIIKNFEVKCVNIFLIRVDGAL